jgi:putative transposase
MKRSRFTEAPGIGILKEGEAGTKTPDLARKHAVSEHTICRWEANYGGMTVSEAQRLKKLEDENRPLKHLARGGRVPMSVTRAAHRHEEAWAIREACMQVSKEAIQRLAEAWMAEAKRLRSQAVCDCGCGRPISGRMRFRQGHDATLRSRYVKEIRAVLGQPT